MCSFFGRGPEIIVGNYDFERFHEDQDEDFEYLRTPILIGSCCEVVSDKNSYFGAVDEKHSTQFDSTVAAVVADDEKFESAAELFSFRRDYELLSILFPPDKFEIGFSKRNDTIRSDPGQFIAILDKSLSRKDIKKARSELGSVLPHIHCLVNTAGNFCFIYKTELFKHYRVTINVDKNDHIDLGIWEHSKGHEKCSRCEKPESKFKKFEDCKLRNEITKFFVSADNVKRFEAKRRFLSELRQRTKKDHFIDTLKRKENKREK